MSKQTKSDKKFNLTITGLWEKRNGTYMSPPLGQAQFDAIQQVEAGGKLLIRFTPEEYLTKESVPEASIEYLSKADVEAYAAKGNYTNNKSVEEDTI